MEENTTQEYIDTSIDTDTIIETETSVLTDTNLLKEKKPNKIKEYFSFRQMKKEIYGYGYTMSGVKYFFFILLGIIITGLFGYLYQMKIGYMIPILFICIGVVPTLIRARFLNLHQKKRFNEVDIYLHQMIYSFQKNPKIYIAIEDTLKVSTGKLKKTLEKALEILDTSVEDTILEDALYVIEKEYNNSRVKALNKYMINIEKKGGEYQTSINIMLTDIDNWINRTYSEQAEIDRVKQANNIGLLLSLFMGGVSSIFSTIMNNMENVQVKGSIANDSMYQVGCLVFVITCIIYFVYTQTSYNKDWVTKTLNDKAVMKDYKNATEFNPTKFRITSIPIYIFFLVIAIIVFFIDKIPYHYILSGILVIFDIYLVISPNIIKKTALKKTKKNIQDSFSEWLRDVSLNLQEEPLLSAIQDTYEECPIALKPELEIFLRRIEEDSTAVEPYYEFLARFHILDISSAIRNLYSLSDVDSVNMDKQLSLLVERNYEIINKNEIAASIDRNAVLHFSEYIPVTLASVKLGIDMLCLIGVML